MKLWSDFVGRVFPTSLDLSFSHRVSSFHHLFHRQTSSTSRFHTECHLFIVLFVSSQRRPLVFTQRVILFSCLSFEDRAQFGTSAEYTFWELIWSYILYFDFDRQNSWQTKDIL